MTAVERIKEALHLLELVDEESHEHDDDYDFAHSIAQDAVYCQMMVNKIVWRCNKVNNPGLEELDPVHVVRCKDCKYAHLTYDGSCKYCDNWEESGEALYLDGDFFCAFGERKGGEDE